MRNNISFNKDNDNLDIGNFIKQKIYPLLSTLNVPFTSYTMSVLLYEIIKLSHQFPKSCLMNIKNPQGSLSKVNNAQFLLHVKSNSVLSFDLYGVLRIVSAPRRLNYS